MGATVPGAAARANRPSAYGGQTLVGGAIDPGCFDGCGGREHPAGVTTRRQLADAAPMAFSVVAGAALFSNQAGQEDLPDWAVVLGTLGGLAACGALWVRDRCPVAVTVAILPVA